MGRITTLFAQLWLPVAAMAFVVVLSNVAVQYPFTPFGLGDYLTWGAFTYPVSFLVTDLTNRPTACGWRGGSSWSASSSQRPPR